MLLLDKLKQMLYERPEWAKNDLHKKMTGFRITREEVPTLLRELKQNGDIELRKRKIVVKNPPTL